MRNKPIKSELIEWLTKLEDAETIQYLKLVKDSSDHKHDWWEDLSDEQKAGIERGKKDVIAGKFTSHNDVKLKYGL
jgi:hypothetical protein